MPESVVKAYGLDAISFGREYIIPKPFDPRVLLWVAPAVAQAAMESGVARDRRLRPRGVPRVARAHPRAVTPGDAPHHAQGAEAARATDRVPRGRGRDKSSAPRSIVEAHIARPILLGRPDVVTAKATRSGSPEAQFDVV